MMKSTRCFTQRLYRKAVNRGALVLVNSTHPLRCPVGEESLAPVAPGVLLEKKAAALLGRVLERIGAGESILPVSGYRTRALQAQILAEAEVEYGEEYAKTYVALPGCSEHETGLALDLALAGGEIDPLTPHFPYEGICQQFREEAVRHGFIQRYTEGREGVTGIGHEPWHFRYLGIPHAGLMKEMGFCLEEYLQWLKAFPYARRPFLYESEGRQYEIGYIPARQEAYTDITVYGGPYTISGNNMDGFVIAVWRNGDEN